MTSNNIKKIRTKQKINYTYPVLVVSRSNKNILAQVLEANTKKTLVTFVSNGLKKTTKLNKSVEIGKEIGKYLKTKKISKVIFDRNGYLYHGRVKQLVESVRESGVEI